VGRISETGQPGAASRHRERTLQPSHTRPGADNQAWWQQRAGVRQRQKQQRRGRSTWQVTGSSSSIRNHEQEVGVTSSLHSSGLLSVCPPPHPHMLPLSVYTHRPRRRWRQVPWCLMTLSCLHSVHSFCSVYTLPALFSVCVHTGQEGNGGGCPCL
jgi:hypothetical protein